MKVLTVDQMRDVEKKAIAAGSSAEQLMQNAGVNLAKVILSKKTHPSKSVIGLVGTGKNGGDTLIALAVLAKAGWDVQACMIKSRHAQDVAYRWFEQVGGKAFVVATDEDYSKLGNLMSHSAVLLDGLLGTGVKLPLRKEIDNLLRYIQTQPRIPYVYAVDCPSGVDCDTGELAESVLTADETVCMGAIKIGLLSFPAFSYAGEISQVDLGISDIFLPENHDKFFAVGSEDVFKVLPIRPRDAHKGTFGKCLIIGGSVMFPGAPMLSAKAAYKVGAGLVQVASPALVQQMMAVACPEVTWFVLPSKDGLIDQSASEIIRKQLCGGTTAALGMGLGHEEGVVRFIDQLFPILKQHKKERAIGFITEGDSNEDHQKFIPPRLIVDADGLRSLCSIKDWHDKLPPQTILTPHVGEMSLLTGLSVEEIQSNRWMIAEKYAKQWGVIVVLKGAATVIADPEGNKAIIPIATPALSKAGSGDVLAGIICGLRAQGMHAFQSAWCGAWIHGKAGLRLEKQLNSTHSVMATDVIDSLSLVTSELSPKRNNYQPVR